MEEVSSCLRMLDEVYKVFGLTYKAALSTRPDSYLGTLEHVLQVHDAFSSGESVQGAPDHTDLQSKG